MLKGKTIIELTDTNTGGVERYEDNNLVTEVIADIILRRKAYLGFSNGQGYARSDKRSSFTTMFPLYERFFGGIMLFSNAVDETRKFLNGNDVIVGSATYGNAYSGLDPLVGSFNEVESEVNETEKYVKYVYDFATNQGNGTISTVCLGNYHYIKHLLFGTNYNGDYGETQLANVLNAPFNIGGWCNGLQSEYNPNFVLFPTGVTFETDGSGVPHDYEVAQNTCYESPLVYDDVKGHLITVEYVSSLGTPSSSNKIDTLRLHVYDIGFNNLNLFTGTDNCSRYSRLKPNEIFTKDFSVDNYGSYGYHQLRTYNTNQCCYDKSTGYAYVLGDVNQNAIRFWNNLAVMTLYGFNLNVEYYEDIALEKFEITNTTGVTIFLASCYSTDSSWRKFTVKDGYMYVPLGTDYSSTGGMAKINIKDSTDVTLIPSEYHKFVCDVQGDFLYLGKSNAYYGTDTVKVYNTKTGEIKETRVKYGSCSHTKKSIPFKNNDAYVFLTGGYGTQSNMGEVLPTNSTDGSRLYWYGTVCSRNDYLATINNLDKPVTKTSDKTMKITYILREERA